MVRNMDNYKKLCIELVLSTCLVVSTLAMSTTNFTTDQLALLSLKQHITSDPGGSILGNNWSTAVSVCEWIGVTCSPRHPGRVTQVNISNMGLAGTIPADIGNLSFLVSLDMRNNNFHGVPPERMVNLRRLRYIDLRFNNFVGEVPSWFGFLDKLQSLLLSKNQFSGVIPKQIGNLYKLEHLRMPYNNLEGGIPKEICNLTMLKSLVLCSNHLTGSIPQEIGNLIKLENLCLQFNSLTGSIPIGIFNISALQIFSLVRNHIIGNLPPNFGYALHNLEEFVIGGNNLSGVIPRSISNCSKLARLSLGQNKFTGKVPNSIGDLRLLEVLDLSENDLTSDQSESPELSLITSLTYCKSLTRLALAALCGASRFHVKSCETVAEHRLKHKRNIRIIFVVLGTATVLSAMAFGFLFFRYRKKDIVSSRRNFSSLMSKPRFSYNELFQATDGWNNRNLLGLGSFGSVYKGTFRDGIVLAIKVFNLELEMAFESFDAECEMLSNFRHRNLTKVITCCSNADFKAIVLEYMPNGSLENWLYSQNHFLDATQRLTIMIDVAYALHYLHHGHSTPMVHCDLKPSNILLSQDMVAHLCDFGISKLLSQESSFTYTQTLATCGYVAPEYGSEGLVSTRCDVYSYGIVLMEVFTRKKPNDEMFGENLSLKSWILDSLPNAIVQVIDDQLD
ncbi:uncharacterized protein [Coffea arabica]|uniref:Uncharacterized protein isoform X4 n=1 Tax=Coffea arabica TaxID=13443 RepID=A0ABM4W2H0_COFAR